MTELSGIVETITTTTPLPLSSLSENIPLVGSVWLISSAIFTTYATTSFLKYRKPDDASSKQLLLSPRQLRQQGLIIKASLPRPVLLTLFRFGGSVLLGFLAQPNFRILQRIQQTKSVIPAFTLPAIFLFIANFTNSMSLNRIGISLTYTSKCAIPLVTVLITMLLEGRKALPNLLTLASLIPIAFGIAAASWNSPRFETFGFIAAMVSCTAQSALNVTSKRAISKTGIAGPQAQRAMVTVGFAISVVYSSFLSIANAVNSNKDKGGASSNTAVTTSATTTTTIEAKKRRLIIPFRTELPSWLIGIAVAAYHIEYTLSFMFVKLVSPISFGTCDAIRRLSIIISGNYMFRQSPFSRLNIMGIGIALLGALSYSICSNSS